MKLSFFFYYTLNNRKFKFMQIENYFVLLDTDVSYTDLKMLFPIQFPLLLHTQFLVYDY